MRIRSEITPLYDAEYYDCKLSTDNIKDLEYSPDNYDEIKLRKAKIKVYDDKVDLDTGDEEEIFVAYMEVYLMEVTDEFVDVADAYSGDLCDAMEKLYLVSKHLDTEDEDYGTTYGYIHVLYVNPKYRKRGISSFLLRNLSEILATHHNIENLFMVAIYKHITDIHIDTECDEVHVEFSNRMEKEDIKKLEVMTKNLISNGFELCTKSNNDWYYRRYNY